MGFEHRYAWWFWLALLPLPGVAGIATDGSLGPARALPGPDYAVSHDLGRQAGGNLFHSFAEFSIAAGESAVFSGPDGLERVIGRVSGGEVSEIHGLLRSEIPGADLYLINPAGVLFGPEARTDLPASLFVAAAGRLEFADGARFSAQPEAAGSSLSLAAPTAFGFLGGEGGAEVRGAGIALAPGQTLALAGADLRILGADLRAERGALHLSAAGDGAASIPLAGEPTGAGALLIEDSVLTVSGDGGGRIGLGAGALEWRNSELLNRNTGARAAAGGSVITARTLEAFDSRLVHHAEGAGAAPPIRLSVGQALVLHPHSSIGGDAYGRGAAPVLEVRAGVLTIAPDGGLASDSRGPGDGGAVTVQADSVHIDQSGAAEAAGITSRAYGGGGGSGSVQVAASGAIELSGGAKISSSSYSAGDAGPVTVQAGSVLIDGGAAAPVSGITSQANRGSGGDAGTIMLTVDGRLEVRNGGLVSSSTWAAGDGGEVRVQAGELLLRGNGDRRGTGIISHAAPGSSGDAGSIQVDVTGGAEIVEGGLISSRTDAAGAGGPVRFSADSLLIRRGDAHSGSGINSQAYLGSSGAAGEVTVDVRGGLQILQGGAIASSSLGAGAAGPVRVSAGELLIDGAGATQGAGTGIASRAWRPEGGDAGDVLVQTGGAIVLLEGGGIGSETASAGNAGRIEIQADSLLIDGGDAVLTTGVSSAARAESGGRAGEVLIRLDDSAVVRGGGVISSSSYNDQQAGRVELQARSLHIDGAEAAPEALTGIFTEALGGGAAAGDIQIRTEALLAVENRGQISSSTYGQGPAGSLSVNAGALRIEGDGGAELTGLINRAAAGSSGAAGRIEVAVGGAAELLQGGLISTRTEGAGNAGGVWVQADSLHIDRGDSISGAGVNSQAYVGSTGDAGQVTVEAAGELSILRGGSVSSSTLGAGDAGRVAVTAEAIHIDGRGATQGAGTGIASRSWGQAAGDAGEIEVRAAQTLSLAAGGGIGSETKSAGDAGAVQVEAGRLFIDGRGSALRTGILSAAVEGAAGAGGSVDVSIREQAEIRSGGVISSSTYGPGDAGRVTLNAGDVLIYDGGERFTGIASRAAASSAGRPGDLFIRSGGLTLLEGARISVAAEGGAAFEPGAHGLRIEAQAIQLDAAAIDAQGRGDSPAAAIQLDLEDRLWLSNGASITTASEHAAGGDIRIQGPRAVGIEQALITTSVAGLRGDGGAIQIDADALVLDRGFVQANTAAPSGRGGDIRIDAGVILSAGEQPLAVGGQQRQRFDPALGLSVIQAAAPQGVSGLVELVSPDVDAAGSVIAVPAEFHARPEIDDQSCQVSAGATPSSLQWHGLARPVFWPSPRKCNPDPNGD